MRTPASKLKSWAVGSAGRTHGCRASSLQPREGLSWAVGVTQGPRASCDSALVSILGRGVEGERGLCKRDGGKVSFEIS